MVQAEAALAATYANPQALLEDGSDSDGGWGVSREVRPGLTKLRQNNKLHQMQPCMPGHESHNDAVNARMQSVHKVAINATAWFGWGWLRAFGPRV